MEKVISNYEVIPTDIKARVPDQYYPNAKEFVEIKEKNALDKEEVFRSKNQSGDSGKKQLIK